MIFPWYLDLDCRLWFLYRYRFNSEPLQWGATSKLCQFWVSDSKQIKTWHGVIIELIYKSKDTAQLHIPNLYNCNFNISPISILRLVLKHCSRSYKKLITHVNFSLQKIYFIHVQKTNSAVTSWSVWFNTQIHISWMSSVQDATKLPQCLATHRLLSYV